MQFVLAPWSGYIPFFKVSGKITSIFQNLVQISLPSLKTFSLCYSYIYFSIYFSIQFSGGYGDSSVHLSLRPDIPAQTSKTNCVHPEISAHGTLREK